MTLFEELKARELLYDTTSDEFEKYITENKVTFYLGCDPTGDSLHVGHLVTYLVAKRFEKYGHHPVLLVGGATGRIGDPKQQGERKMLEISTIENYVEKLKKQVREIFGFETIVNNYDWTHNISILDFLRDYGKEFNVNYMINKETVKARLESGISYTEFSYQILQALDWYHLYKTLGCTVQIGGQDQWGNMTSGTELIRKKEGVEAKAYAMTIPLILKTDGTKFGKSEGGKSVWLDKEKTSPYEFYQFWINIPDDDVIRKLKQFTFLPLEEIALLEEAVKTEPHLRKAQKALARELTTFIHGEEAYLQAVRISEALFSGKVQNLTVEDIDMGFDGVPSIELTEETSLIDLLVNLSAAKSKREARDFITGGGVLVNGEQIKSLEYMVSKSQAIGGKYIIVRRGKKNYYLVKC